MIRSPHFGLIAGFLLGIQLAGSFLRGDEPASASAGGDADSAIRTWGPYPMTRASDQVDDYHGVRVADPYRWLEELDTVETKAWVEAQNEVTFGFLEGIPERAEIQSRLTELWDYERYGVPTPRGGRYFYTKNDGLQNQAVLYVADSLDGAPRALIDPNAWSTDGTVSLNGMALSDDGTLLAYSRSSAGSDWQEWRVRDVATGQDRADLLKWVKASGASWTPDGLGFYYSRYDEPAVGAEYVAANYFQKLYYHRLGDDQDEDRLVYERPDHKEWGIGGNVTEDGRYLIVHIWQGTDPSNAIFYRDLGEPDSSVVELLPDFDASYNFVGNVGSRFLFHTDSEAPRGRIIAIDVTDPDRGAWVELVGQSDDSLQTVNRVGDRLFAEYLRDAHSHVAVFDLDGKPVGEVELPGLGTANGFAGRETDRETFYSFTGFATPAEVYRYDLATGESTLTRRPKADFDPEDYETKQVFYTGKDGARVPMFIAHKRGLTLDGDAPTLLYGYGGFNNPLTPGFSVTSLVWMERGGVYAVANLRGGGEYGREWHEAGRKDLKQNVFDDFIAAGEWLIENGYTSPKRLAILGRSNGGLLVGACLNQRPDLFGAAIAGVGVMDMLRYHKFTIGWAWIPEYGSADDAEQFKTLFAYSPLHNIRPGASYPPTLITTGDHDDRVVPGHSYKYAAALQAAQGGEAPILIRIDTKAGHGGGKPTAKLIEESADTLSFLFKAIGAN